MLGREQPGLRGQKKNFKNIKNRGTFTYPFPNKMILLFARSKIVFKHGNAPQRYYIQIVPIGCALNFYRLIKT